MAHIIPSLRKTSLISSSLIVTSLPRHLSQIGFFLFSLITNFESHSAKLIQIVLSGQNNLRNKLKLKKALLSRSAAVATIDPLTLDETREMINFRVHIAGRKIPLFEDEAIQELFEQTKGVPREIVKVCMDSLTLAAINKLPMISREVVQYGRVE